MTTCCVILIVFTIIAGMRVYVIPLSFAFSPAALFSALNFLTYFVSPLAIELLFSKNFDHLLQIQLIVLFNQAFIFMYLLLTPRLDFGVVSAKYPYYDVFIPLLVLSLVVLVILLANILHDSGLSFNEIYKESRAGGNAWKVYLGYVTPYVPFIYLYVTRKSNYKFYCLLFISFVCITLTGARIGYFEIVLLYLMLVMALGRVNYIKAIAFFVFLLLLIVMLTLVRMKEFGISASPALLIKGFAGFMALSFDMPMHFDRVIDYVHSNGVLWGRTLVDVVNYFMPSSLFPGKLQSTEAARTIYDFAEEKGSGYNFGIYAIDYLNFGLAGSLILPAVAFVFFSKMYEKFITLARKVRYPQVYQFLYAYFSIKILIAVRLGIFTHFLGMVILQGGFIVFTHFYLSGYIAAFRSKLHRSVERT